MINKSQVKIRFGQDKIIALFLMILCCAFCFSCSDVFAQALSSSVLLNNTKQYDGRVVVYQGEVIGDIMVRGNHAWFHVNEGGIAIGVWAHKTLISDILNAGDYHTRGDIVQLRGIFSRACLEHGGDLDIHAQAITKISSGNKVSRPIDKRAVNFGIGISCVVLIVCLWETLHKNKPIIPAKKL